MEDDRDNNNKEDKYWNIWCERDILKLYKSWLRRFLWFPVGPRLEDPTSHGNEPLPHHLFISADERKVQFCTLLLAPIRLNGDRRSPNNFPHTLHPQQCVVCPYTAREVFTKYVAGCRRIFLQQLPVY
jgi:hypothetical protein